MLNLQLAFLVFIILFNQNVVVVEGSSKSYAIDIVALDALSYHDLIVFKTLRQNEDKHFSSALHNVLNEYILDFEESHGIENSKKISSLADDANEDWMRIYARKVADNPISALRMIWRTTKILPRLQHQIESDNSTEIGFKKLDELPDEEDLNMAYRGIIYLQIFYQLSSLQLAKGSIRGVRTNAKLNAYHCFEIGFYGATRQYFSYGLEWLETSLKLIKKNNDTSIGRSRVKVELEKAIDLHDEGYKIMDDGGPDELQFDPRFFEFPLRLPREKDIENGEIVCKEIIQCAPKKRRRFGWNIQNRMNEASSMELQTHRLCNGANYQTEKEKSQLFCWYESRANRYFWIGPLKMEILSRGPDVVKVHKLFHDKIIQQVEKAAMEISYNREGVASHPKALNISGSIEDVESRIGMKSEVPDQNETYGIKAIPRVIQLITGLQLIRENSTEKLRVVAYTFASHFRNHIDTGGAKKGVGQKLITFMFYMSDVEMGGFTSFPRIGLGIKPEKGSAVFWFDLLANGEKKDQKTLHSACPPLIGRKRSGTRYAHFLHHFQSHPCHLKEESRISVPINGQFLPK